MTATYEPHSTATQRQLLIPTPQLSFPPSLPLPSPPPFCSLPPPSESELREWAWVIERCLDYLADKQRGTVSATATTASAPLQPLPSQPPANTVVRLSGVLTKKGGQRRNWKERWFELNDKVLQYFDNTIGPQGLRKPRGTIMLDNCLAVNRVAAADDPFRFHIELPVSCGKFEGRFAWSGSQLPSRNSGPFLCAARK